MFLIGFIISLMVFLTSTADSAVLDNYFINQSYGARIMAIGEASTAVCGDPEGMYFNPAANGFIEKIKVASSYNDYYRSSFIQGSFVAAIPLPSLGVLSGAIPLKIINDIPLTAQPLNGGEFVQAGLIKNLAVAGYLSFATQITQSLAVGATVKMIKEKLYNSNASGLGYDIGVIYKINSELARINLALSILDIGNTALVWDTKHFDYLPMTTRMGIAAEKDIFEGKLSLAADIASRESGSTSALGAAYQISSLTFRYGMNNRNGHNLTSYGMGLQVGSVDIDYAVQNDENLGMTSKVSTGINF